MSNTKDLLYKIFHTFKGDQVVVYNDDQAIAFMLFQYKGYKCKLNLIRVEEGYRRRGISTILLNILENECMDNGINIIEGRYYPLNENAKYMYENHGYKIYQDGYEKYIIKIGLSKHDIDDISIQELDSKDRISLD